MGGADALSAGQLCVVLRSFGNAEIAKAVRFLADYDPVRHIVVAVEIETVGSGIMCVSYHVLFFRNKLTEVNHVRLHRTIR